MSTKRQKKTDPVKTSPLTETGYSLTYDPTLIRHSRRVGRRTKLDEELEAEDDVIVRDLKETRAEEINMKRKARIAKYQREIDKLKEAEGMNSDGAEMPQISIDMARQIADLPQEEQAKIMQTYAAFRSIDKSKGGGSALLPLIVGFSKSNPGTPQINMLDYAKVMNAQLNTGIELMKAARPEEKPSSQTDLLKIFSGLVEKSMVKPLEDLARNMQAQKSPFEEILMNPDMFARAKEIGMFGSREPATAVDGPMALEIEKLRGEREMGMKKMDLEWKRDVLERDTRDKRSDDILALVIPIATAVTPALAQSMRQLGERQAATHRPTNPVTQVPPPAGTNIEIQCTCGHKEIMHFQGEVPSKINCPGCDLELTVGGPPPGDS